MPLLQDRRIDPDPLRRAIDDGEAGVRIRLDQEAVPALELRLDPAAVLVNPGDEIGEVGLEPARVAERRARPRVLPRVRGDAGEPGEEARRRVGERGLARHGCAGFGRALEQVPLVVVVAIEHRPVHRDRLRGARRVLVPGLAQPRPEGRAHDPDVEVVDRGELELLSRGAGRVPLRVRDRRRERPGRVVRVAAVGGHEPGDQIRDRLLEVGLLVPHRRGVVDREEEVDPGDRLLRDLGGEVRLRRRLAGDDGTIEAPTERDREGQAEDGRHLCAANQSCVHRMERWPRIDGPICPTTSACAGSGPPCGEWERSARSTAVPRTTKA